VPSWMKTTERITVLVADIKGANPCVFSQTRFLFAAHTSGRGDVVIGSLRAGVMGNIRTARHLACRLIRTCHAKKQHQTVCIAGKTAFTVWVMYPPVVCQTNRHIHHQPLKEHIPNMDIEWQGT
jgi:hypothetical protein